MIAISLEVGQPVAAATYETAITLDHHHHHRRHHRHHRHHRHQRRHQLYHLHRSAPDDNAITITITTIIISPPSSSPSPSPQSQSPPSRLASSSPSSPIIVIIGRFGTNLKHSLLKTASLSWQARPMGPARPASQWQPVRCKPGGDAIHAQEVLTSETAGQGTPSLFKLA